MKNEADNLQMRFAMTQKNGKAPAPFTSKKEEQDKKKTFGLKKKLKALGSKKNWTRM